VPALIFAAVSVVWLARSGEQGYSAERPRRPNIIVVLTDDMGYSDIGCFGGEIHTPNIDKLAAGGLRFTQFYNTARCCPSRASLLTGLYPHQADMGAMAEDNYGLDGYEGDLNRSCVTIAQVLKGAGYAAYAVGKWHVASGNSREGPKHNWPLQRGFDRYYGTICGCGDYFDPATLTRDNRMISPFADPQYKPAAYYYTDAITDNAVQYIGDHCTKAPQRPFFLYVAYTAAHWPMNALPEDIAKYQGMYDNGYEPIRRARYERLKKMGIIQPDWILSPQAGDWDRVKNKPWEARCMEVYAAIVDRMDQGVGRIVDELKQENQLDDTLICFLQDNGGCAEDTGRHGTGHRPNAPTFPPIPLDTVRVKVDCFPKQTRDGFPVLTGQGVMPGPADTFIAYGQSWANVSNTPLRYYKHFVHEGGISTPLVVHWPAGISRRGELEAQPGHLVDLMATCADVAGASYPAEYQGHKITPREGKSLRPAFAGKSIDRTAPLFWEHEGNRALREGKWKLVARYPSGNWELYDMEKDRTEMRDLSAMDPQRVRAMAAQWEAFAKRTHVLPWPWKPAYGAKDQ
jgi:arylsulfatase